MQSMKYIDISWPITNDMTTYKDRKNVRIEDIATFKESGYQLSQISISSHAGTHVDAPCHFLEQGNTVDHISLDTLLGPCEVIDLRFVEGKIARDHLSNIPIVRGSRILMKTRNSNLEPTAPFKFDFVALDVSAAEYLAACGVRTVGLDYLGIERDNPDHHVHKILMEQGITIIEGLRLAQVNPGRYNLICLPLLLVGHEAAPARALLEMLST